MRKIEHFWYITSIDNLKSIFQYGILCRSLIDIYTILSEGCVDDTRRSVQQFYKKFQDFLMSNISGDSFVLFGQQFLKELKSLSIDESDTYTKKSKVAFTTDISDSGVQELRKEFHTSVPLFFADNTPMLYTVFKHNYENVCLLEINKEVKGIEGVQFSNDNVASSETNVYDSLDGLTDGEWEIIYSREPTFWDRKRIRSAEVLVPYKVPVEYITSISVDADTGPTNPHNQVLSSVVKAGLDIPVNMNLTLSGVC